MERGCPICFRLRQMLVPLCLDRGLRLTEVEVESGSGSLMGRYRFFLERVFGGERHTPVVLVGRSRWYVPRRTTRWRRDGVSAREDIESACLALIREIERDLDRWFEEEYPPTHSQMRTGVTPWRPSMF